MSEIVMEAENSGSAIFTAEEYSEDGRNKYSIRCPYCDSSILEKKAGIYVVQEKEIPLMIQNTKNGNLIQTETLKDFYHVEDMYTFENIGFTHTVENTKYLTCVDCKAGPLGYHDIDTKHSYVALARIKHIK